MIEQDFPALYRSADKLSMDSQKHFFRILLIHLCVLVLAAVFSIIDAFGKWVDRCKTGIGRHYAKKGVLFSNGQEELFSREKSPCHVPESKRIQIGPLDV